MIYLRHLFCDIFAWFKYFRQVATLILNIYDLKTHKYYLQPFLKQLELSIYFVELPVLLIS